MTFKPDIIVSDKSKFPDWKKACPSCGEQKCISTRKDGTGAYCKLCKQNWKLPEAYKNPEKAEELGKKKGEDGWNIIADEIAEIKRVVNKVIELNNLKFK